VPARRLVYSTERGRVRPPSSRPPESPSDGVVRIARERSGRGGKTVTVIRGLPERGEALAARAAALKHRCGAGGTVTDDAVLIQGDDRVSSAPGTREAGFREEASGADWRERIAERLRAWGYRVELAGG